MHSICFFNNKGGVGKTTLLCNVASYIASTTDKRVLVVDADPQCNATQLIMPDEQLDEIYPVDEDASSGEREVPTLADVLHPMAAGDPAISAELHVFEHHRNRFGVDLIPGDPRLSLMEDTLSQQWLNFEGGQIAGGRISNWNTQLVAKCSEKYDIAFFDVGPSLGALNRSVLIGVDHFVTPLGCDVFSVMGVRNISGWLGGWLKSYSDGLARCKEKKWNIEEFVVRRDPQRIARFLGYTVQQYITKKFRGKRRATVAYDKILAGIPAIVIKELGQFAEVPDEVLQLPDVPHMYSLVPLAQAAHAPIHAVDSADGLVGAQYSQRGEYVEFIKQLSEGILANLERDNDGD